MWLRRRWSSAVVLLCLVLSVSFLLRTNSSLNLFVVGPLCVLAFVAGVLLIRKTRAQTSHLLQRNVRSASGVLRLAFIAIALSVLWLSAPSNALANPTGPNLTITLTNNVSGNVLYGNTFHWTVTLTNTGDASATIPSGQMLAEVDFPSTGLSYSSPQFSCNGIVGTGDINGQDQLLVSEYLDSPISSGGQCTFTITVTPSTYGTFDVPRSGGICRADPNNGIAESNENDNDCSNTVIVKAFDLSITKTNNVSGSVEIGNTWDWTIKVTNLGNLTLQLSPGQHLFDDNLPTNATYSYVSTSDGGGVTGSWNFSVNSPSFPHDVWADPITPGVTIPPNGWIQAVFQATPSAAGVYANPRSGGSCHTLTDSFTSNDSCTDSVTVTATPDLTISKTNNVSGQTNYPNGWTWTLKVSNSGNGDATFTNGQTIFLDNLPTGVNYSGVGVGSSSGVTGTPLCGVNVSSDFSCSANITVTIASGGYLNVGVNAVPNDGGTFANPRSSGECKVDPDGNITELSDSNNTCSDSVTVVNTQTGPNLVVNSSADTDDGSCDVSGHGIGNQDCTLREAINRANTYSGAATIVFDIPNMTGCTAANHCTITLGSTLPAISNTNGVTTNGAPNNGHITVSGNGNVRVMQISDGAILHLQSLTIVNGKGQNCGMHTCGGGMLNDGTLTVVNSTFIGNTADDDSGGIANRGTLSVYNSTFSGNSSNTGGGIDNFASSTMTILNSTFSGNTAGGGSGAGIANNGTLSLSNTIIANSTGSNCSGVSNATDHNLADDSSCSGAVQATSAQINLDALANNGGIAETFALKSGSVALDSGDDSICSDVNTINALDQRGVARPQGAHCDVGALEAGLLQGEKFQDNDGNGSKNGNDSGLSGWTIHLLNTSDNVLDSTTTDASGNYTLTVGSLPFTYRVREVSQNGWLQTTNNPTDVALTLASPGASAINFGNFEKISISGQKFNDLNGNGVQDTDEPGLQGWTINLEDTLDNVISSTTTNASGAFEFSDRGPGTYRVREVNQTGWVQTTANPEDIAASSGKDATGILFGNTYETDLSIVKTYKFNKNGSVTFRLKVINAGPGNARRVVVTDTLPSLWVYDSVSASHGKCTFANGILTCNLGVLKEGKKVTVTLVVDPPKSLNSFTNCGEVSSTTFDPNTSDNESCVSKP